MDLQIDELATNMLSLHRGNIPFNIFGAGDPVACQ